MAVAIFGHLCVLFSDLGRNFCTVRHFMTGFATIMASDDNFLAHAGVIWTSDRRQLEARMRVAAVWPFGAKSGQVIETKNSADMPMSAGRAVAAESAVVPGTIPDFGLGINVKERTFFVVTGIKSGVKVTFRHLRHVILVQKLASIALFAQASKPMFAHNRFVASHMSERAICSFLARAFHVKVTNGCPGFVHAWKRHVEGSELVSQSIF